MVRSVLRPVDDDARREAKRLLRTVSRAALATIEPADGWPYSSLATVATAMDGAPLLLVSSLSAHTRALAADPRCSLLLAADGAGDPLAHPRLTVFGRARFLPRDSEEHRQARRRFLARHPKASRYCDFADFSLVSVEPARALLNAGFGRASELAATDFNTPLDERLQPLLAAEAAALLHVNRDHADAVRQIARRLCGGPEGAWQLVALDPEGLVLCLDGRCLRYPFPEPLTDADELRDRLVTAARAASLAAR